VRLLRLLNVRGYYPPSAYEVMSILNYYINLNSRLNNTLLRPSMLHGFCMGENQTTYSHSMWKLLRQYKKKIKNKKFSLWKLIGKCMEKVSLQPLLSYFPCIFHSHMQRRPYIFHSD
jgi:hypothetical protein